MQHTVPQKWGERVSQLYSRQTWQGIVRLGTAAGFEFNYGGYASCKHMTA